MSNNPINIDQIRLDYITGADGLRTLSKRYSVSIPWLAKLSKDNHWVDQRKEHREKVARKTLTKAAAVEVDRNTRHLRIYDKLSDALEKIADANVKNPDIKITRDCVLAMSGIQEGQRTCLGLDKTQGNSEAHDALTELMSAIRENINTETT